MEDSLNQSSWSRAKQDTISAQTTAHFMWGGEGMLAVAGGTWLSQIAPASAPTLEIVARSVIGGLGGLATAIILIFAWNLFRAPYKQRNEARQRIEELEAELKKPKLFDVEWRTTTLGLPVNHREDGTWISSSARLSPVPINIVHRGDLTTVTRITIAPEIRFIYKDGSGWMSTDTIIVTPQRPLPPSMRPSGATDFDWDVSNPSQWVLTGLPLPMAKDELLQLPGIELSVSDATSVGKHFEKGDKCTLTVRLAIRTDKGSPVLPDLSIELTLSDIKNVEWLRSIGRERNP